jgi:DNA-binding MarR family transcriptional regulator
MVKKNSNNLVSVDSIAIESIADNLFYVLPILHKKVMKIEPPAIDCGVHISRQHIGIMVRLSMGTLPMSEIARDYLIPKPQMTFLINQLYKAGLVDRRPNRNDRRVTDVTLTDKGKEVFNQCDKYLKNNVKEQLSFLTEKEIEDFAATLQKLKEIGARLEDQE